MLILRLPAGSGLCCSEASFAVRAPNLSYRDAPHHWHLINDSEKRPTDNSVYISGGTSINDITYQSNQSFIFDLNEKRSSIRVISPQYIDRFVEDFETMINE